MRISDWSSDVCSADLFFQVDAGRIMRKVQYQHLGFRRDGLAHFLPIDTVKTSLLRRCLQGNDYRPSASKLNRSEEHTSELQSLMRISYAVFCLKQTKTNKPTTNTKHHIK